MSTFANWYSEYKLYTDDLIWIVIEKGISCLKSVYIYGDTNYKDIDLSEVLCPELIYVGVLFMWDRCARMEDEEFDYISEQSKEELLACRFANAVDYDRMESFLNFLCKEYCPGKQFLNRSNRMHNLKNSLVDIYKQRLRYNNRNSNVFFESTKRLFDTYKEKRDEIAFFTFLKLCEEFQYEEKTDNEEDTIVFSELSQYYVNLRNQLSETIICQDAAIRKFVQGLMKGRMRTDTDNSGPEATYLFVGPPGVGKTFLAETAAKVSGRDYKIFQMNEYAGTQSNEELIGFAKTWKNSREGKLTGFVARHPNAVIVFDEIEKAHINTLHQFLSILEGGFLTDLYTERDVDFTNTILIFTTNAGRDFYEEKKDMLISSISESMIVDALKNDKKPDGTPCMPTEILSRLAKGNIIGFDHMNPAKLVPIIKKGIRQGKEIVRSKLGLECQYDVSVLPYIFLYHLGTQLDARVAATRSRDFIKECMYNLVERIGENPTRFIEAGTSQVIFEVENEDVARQFIEPDEKSKVMLVSYRKDRGLFSPEDNDRFVRFDAWDQTDEQGNQIKVKEILTQHDISAILIDPFMTGVSLTESQEELEGLMHMNTHGNNVLQWLLKQKDIPPVYALELRNQISLADQMELQRQGVKGILNLINMDADACKKVVNDLVYELFLASKVDALTSKGRSLEFDIGHRIDENGITLRLHNFKLITNMSVDAVDVVVGDGKKPEITFEDVIGAENAKEELRKFIRFINEPEMYRRSGLQVSKGILLYGPPGTGKTVLAKALAAEADCPFIATTGAQFVNGSKDISKVFQLARKYAPSVVFIDEIDSFALDRSRTDSVRATILNNLLTEMDGFSTRTSKPVFVIAATNAAQMPSVGGNNIFLDTALQRRFTKKVYVDLPNREERLCYLNQCKKKIAAKVYNLNNLLDEELNEFSRLTAGHSIAEMENVINIALGRAAESNENVTKELLINCFEESVYGEKLKISEHHLLTTALHEAGHAFLGFENGERFYPEYATLVARANYLGMVAHNIEDDYCGYSKDDYRKQIRMKLAGRAAEIVFNGPDEGLTTGAGSDLEGATYCAAAILSRYGMEEGYMPVISMDTMLKSPLAETYYTKLNEILETELKNTIRIIEDNKDKLERLAEALIEKSRLETEEMYEVLYGK